MNGSQDLLVAIQQKEFTRAAAYDKWLLRILGTIALFALVALILPEPRWARLVAVIVMLLVIVALVLAWEGEQRRVLAEKARRVTYTVNGLGIPLPDLERSRFKNHADLSDDELRKWGNPLFFTTKEHPGSKRLLEMVMESAFFSEQLFRRSSKSLQLWLLLIFLLLLFVFLLALNLFEGRHAPLLVGVFATVASSLVFVELLLRRLRYGSAEREVAEILRRLDSMCERGYPKDEIIWAVGDYNAAVERAPLMWPGVYARYRDRLHREWNDYFQKRCGKG